MSLLTRILEEKRSTVSNLSNPQQWLLDLLGGRESKAGIRVTADTALQVSAVFACVRYLSRTVAALPCQLYKRSDRGKDKAVNHPIYWLLHQLPNPETTAYDFWLMLMVNHLLSPEAYAYIERDGNGIITALWNVPSNRVKKYRNKTTKELYYGVLDDDGREYTVYPENMFVLRNMRFSSKDASLDPIELAREALGLSLAMEEYGAKYFANGANPGGVVQVPGKMSDPAFQRFKESFLEKYAGVANAAKVVFLEENATYQKVANTPEESQAIDARKHQVVEVARFFGVPLHKILDLERSTNNNIEHQSIEAVQDCLTPYLVQLEQEISKDLLLPSERKRYFAKFDLRGLLRGDSNARKDFYHAMIQDGVFSPNDVLELEDMDTYEGGEIHMVNGNMIPVDKIGELAEARIKKGGETNGAGTPNPA
jgi:HK97 family phage portal protein